MIPYSQLMIQAALGNSEIVYSWQHPVTHKVRMWAIGRLEEYLPTSGVPILEAELRSDKALWFVQNRGIEPHRLSSLASFPEALEKPLILMRMDAEPGVANGLLWDLMMDGHHRYVTKYALGHKTFRFYHVPEETALEFEISGVPQTSPEQMRRFVQEGFSGLGVKD